MHVITVSKTKWPAVGDRHIEQCAVRYRQLRGNERHDAKFSSKRIEPSISTTASMPPGFSTLKMLRKILSGSAQLRLGDRVILAEPGNVAEFSTMIPHAIGAHDGPVETMARARES